MFAAALLLGCTGIDEPLDFEVEQLEAAVELEFVIVPPRDEAPADVPPSAPTLEPPPTPMPTPARWGMWLVLEDLDVSLEYDLSVCDVELPEFPTVAADGSVLALALVSSPVADELLITVRMLRSEDGKQVRAYTLIGPGESELVPDEELQRRVCHRATALARALASHGHTTMPVVGGWENHVRDGLPTSAQGWPRVIGDGATHDVDMAVADIVIAPANTDAPELHVSEAGPTACRGSSDQFSKVWEAAGLRVFTRGPCGC
jgi:hypothetical protein